MKQTLKNIDVKNKKVIVRVDYNVPLNEKFEVADDERIQRTIPTIKYLLENEASIILISHLGRPKGKYMSKMSLFPVVKHLSDLLNINVKFLKNDCFSEETHKGVAGLKKREICLLENLRFRPEEDGKNLAGIKDEIAMNKFAKKMASMGDIFVQDAFGILHRRQASTIGIVKYVNEVCIGFLVE
ncbi:MAG: phosphoglycerate kinase, partial [Endomicrobium sp.]|nr:phosphoglycerate kinase [Endomicrobium sp.]